MTLKQLQNDIELVMTCCACPEQYDAMYGGQIVGYLRMRWGTFTVRYPSVAGEVVYSYSDCKGGGRFTPEERGGYLKKAREAIAKKLLERLQEG